MSGEKTNAAQLWNVKKCKLGYAQNKWLIFAIAFSMAMLIAGIVGGILVRGSYTSAGIEKVRTLQDLQQLDIVINCSMIGDGEEKENLVYEHYKENADMYIEQLKDADVICVVIATGNLEFYRGSFYQEVIVKQVIEDASGSLEIDDVIKIFDYECLVSTNGRINYKDSTNLLNPDNGYLVFITESELNDIADRKNYNFIDNTFSCICLNREQEQKVCASDDFWENWGINEFFYSQKLLNQYLEIEERIIECYHIFLKS